MTPQWQVESKYNPVVVTVVENFRYKTESTSALAATCTSRKCSEPKNDSP